MQDKVLTYSSREKNSPGILYQEMIVSQLWWRINSPRLLVYNDAYYLLFSFNVFRIISHESGRMIVGTISPSLASVEPCMFSTRHTQLLACIGRSSNIYYNAGSKKSPQKLGEYLVGSVPTGYYLGNSIANNIGELLPDRWPPSPGQYHGRRGPAPPNSSSLHGVGS